MDPISIGLGVVGLGMQLFGGLSGASVAKQQASVSQDEAKQEQAINAQKTQQMQLQAQRGQLENFRNLQRARAQGLNSATQQGAQYGSGLAGGAATQENQGIFNELGINQSLQTGMAVASLNNNISADKIQMAALGGTAATDQGIASMGGAIMKAGPIIGAFGKNVGASGGMFMGGGSPSGYGTG